MDSSQNPDQLYARDYSPVGAFQFDERVAAVFSDMIHRSVPGYETLLHLIGCLAALRVSPGSYCYDLGCSLGGVSLVLQQTITAPGCSIIAVDTSEAMVERCRRHVSLASGRVPITVHQGDARTFPMENASLVVLNYTLQFIPVEERLPLLQRIRKAMLPGGILILSEKLAEPAPFLQPLHEQFKRSMGYSELEISRKRTALENVLVPETEATHRERLLAAGFTRVERWFQALQFTSFLAVADESSPSS